MSKRRAESIVRPKSTAASASFDSATDGSRLRPPPLDFPTAASVADRLRHAAGKIGLQRDPAPRRRFGADAIALRESHPGETPEHVAGRTRPVAGDHRERVERQLANEHTLGRGPTSVRLRRRSARALYDRGSCGKRSSRSLAQRVGP